MSTSVCFYFQVHQPFRLKKNYHFFDIGRSHFYEDSQANSEILRKVAQKSYLPTNKIMLDLIKKYQGSFKISYSLSGTVIEQFELYAPEVLDSFKRLVDTGCVEILSETYYHSLAFIFSKEEFRQQVLAHREKVQSVFGVTPSIFRNTELIYNDELALEVEKMGLKAVLAEGVDRILEWKSPNFVYSASNTKNLKLLLKNYKLSDDIAFRFSNREWNEYPLNADKYANWVHAVAGNGQTINLFMDYETFGEHQWEDTGIFSFLEYLPEKILRHTDFNFKTPSEVIKAYPAVDAISMRDFTSWADVERDLSAWLGNSMQDSAIEFAYSLENKVKATKDNELIHTWRKLLTSDHFYYLCTKWFNDGDVHKYFNPFATPHDAFISYINILNDLKLTIEKKKVCLT